MSFETGYIPELFDDRNAYVMARDEIHLVTDNVPPVLTAGESLAEFGIDAALKLVISASTQKTFYVFDTRDTRYGLVFPERPGRLFRADYLLVDDQFSPDSSRGFKGIRTGEDWIQVGRLHLRDRFNYPDTVSRTHFNIKSLESGIAIHNVAQTNGTTLRMKIEDASEISLPETVPPVETAEVAPMFDVGLAEQALKGEDRSLVVSEAALFGVFDGMGGHVDGALAAETAAKVVREAYLTQTLDSNKSWEAKASRLRRALQAASLAIEKTVPDGGSTGVVVQIVRSNAGVEPELDAIWSAAGDSRLYHIHEDKIRQVSVDEGVGNRLRNCLGLEGVVRQAGHLALEAGDQLVLVSDGITGDYAPDLLSDDEVLEACQDSDAQTAAQNLVDISRKRDDKTAIVINL